MPESDVDARIAVCTERLASMCKLAPELCCWHLRYRLDVAIEKRDKVATNAIKRTLRNKAFHRRRRNVKTAAKPQSGGVVPRLMFPNDSGLALYTTKDGVEQQASQNLKQGS